MGRRREANAGFKRKEVVAVDLNHPRFYNSVSPPLWIQSPAAVPAVTSPPYTALTSLPFVLCPLAGMEVGTQSGRFVGNKFYVAGMTVRFFIHGRCYNQYGPTFNVPFRLMVVQEFLPHFGDKSLDVPSSLLHAAGPLNDNSSAAACGAQFGPASVFKAHALDRYRVLYDKVVTMPFNGLAVTPDVNDNVAVCNDGTLTDVFDVEFEHPVEVQVDERATTCADADYADPKMIEQYCTKNQFWVLAMPFSYYYRTGAAGSPPTWSPQDPHAVAGTTYDARTSPVFRFYHMTQMQVRYFTP